MQQEGKKERQRLDKLDLIKEFEEQIHNLTLLNTLYDQGHETIAKDIAVRLRVLLFSGEGRSRSKSLLSLLKLEHVPFADYSAPYNSKNILTHHGLVGLRFEQKGTVYYPVLHNLPIPRRLDNYENWWKKRIVFKGDDGVTFTRKSFVLELADTDGGAHVDEGLGVAYHKLSRKNSLGWFSVQGDGFKVPLGNPVPPSIRQVSHEVIETFRNVDLNGCSRLR